MQALKVCFRPKNDFLTVKAGLVRIVEYCDHYHYTCAIIILSDNAEANSKQWFCYLDRALCSLVTHQIIDIQWYNSVVVILLKFQHCFVAVLWF